MLTKCQQRKSQANRRRVRLGLDPFDNPAERRRREAGQDAGRSGLSRQIFPADVHRDVEIGRDIVAERDRREVVLDPKIFLQVVRENCQFVAGEELLCVPGAPLDVAEELERRGQHLGDGIEGEHVQHQGRLDGPGCLVSQELPDLVCERWVVVRNNAQEVDFLQGSGRANLLRMPIAVLVSGFRQQARALRRLVIGVLHALREIVLYATVVPFLRFLREALRFRLQDNRAIPEGDQDVNLAGLFPARPDDVDVRIDVFLTEDELQPLRGILFGELTSVLQRLGA